MEVEDAEIQAPSDQAELKNKEDNQDLAKGNSSRKRKQKEAAFSVLDRPARERKSIDRLIISPDKEVKEFKVHKGSGSALKDIPNVAFKLSKRRIGDEAVQALHKVLFGRTSAKHTAKGNILQFSGFVWSGDEEKEKAKVKEKLEKLVRENLYQVSDLLDMPSTRSLKKEDLVLKIFEFLESPHKMTDKLVEESGKSKRGRKAKKTPVKGSKTKASGKSPKKSPTQSRKGAKKTPHKKQSSEEEDESDAAEFDEDIEEPEDKSDDDYAKKSSSGKKRKRSSPKKKAAQKTEEKEVEEEPLPKKKKPRKVEKEKKEPIQKARKEKAPKKKAAKVEEPSDENLREAICELLQNADFSKVTFTDVMKQLGGKFNTDLSHRKAQLKAMIQEEIHKLVDEGENEDEDGDKEGEIDDRDKANGDEQDEHEDGSGDVKAEDEDHEAASAAVKADDEEEDGNRNDAGGDKDEEEGDDAKPDGDTEDEDRNSSEEDKRDDEDKGEDVKEEMDHEVGAEEVTGDAA